MNEYQAVQSIIIKVYDKFIIIVWNKIKITFIALIGLKHGIDYYVIIIIEESLLNSHYC